MTFLLSIIKKSIVFTYNTSACRQLSVSQSIKINMSWEYTCLSKEKKAICTIYACCTESGNNVELYMFVCVERTYLK